MGEMVVNVCKPDLPYKTFIEFSQFIWRLSGKYPIGVYHFQVDQSELLIIMMFAMRHHTVAYMHHGDRTLGKATKKRL